MMVRESDRGQGLPNLPDAEARDHEILRVIDEDRSEPDGYLYSASMFVPIELPDLPKRALSVANLQI